VKHLLTWVSFSSSHSGPGRKGLVEGRKMDEDQYDPFEDEELFVGEEESEE